MTPLLTTTLSPAGDPRQWRVWHFPALRPAGFDTPFSGTPAQLQQCLSDSVEEGRQQGYLQGLQEGREAGREDGLQLGQEQGRQVGLEQGRNAGRESFERAAAPLQRIGEAWQRYRDDFDARRREELLALVGKVAQQVIRCELTLNPAQLLALAEEALAAMPIPPSEVHVLLNPDECARIRDLAPERAQQWRLVADDSLALGECRVVTPQAELDIGCQQRLDACLDTLAGHLQLDGE
jgi:flagellar assembly protein FliH